MITNVMINDKFAELKRAQDEYNELYKAAIKEQLQLHNLDGAVVRKADNKRGEIVIITNATSLKSPYKIAFCPYREKGEVSKRHSLMDIPVEETNIFRLVEKTALNFANYDNNKE